MCVFACGNAFRLLIQNCKIVIKLFFTKFFLLCWIGLLTSNFLDRFYNLVLAHSVLTENGITYMTLCEKAYSTQLAYNFLSDLKKEFYQLYGHEVHQVERPYAFIKFDTFIEKSKRVYSDTRTKRNIQKLKDELEDVQQIMKKNIEEVIGRGQKLDNMNTMSSNLLDGAKKMKTRAVDLNKMYFWRTYGYLIVVFAIVILMLILRYYLW